ncbi:NUDIX domain-containing protein [Halomonas sp. KAO]|uniref:NUDIX hydrolase n=1 Tax=unclassified Halomonas TaxID=2609666 RepID=UPI0018A06876|nr:MULTISPECIES: NUDIX domain-containing protein [unclassified Halomonas]MBF7054933.1 NUDIX domain-containing protein [Halomonas sp. KAO]MDT0501470.1 NUDIX domain-containing protein [Halomonas sp. PAR7]MDT0512848.1 NUDIX domain-containing protein [Halomonas sp. LES1]MDT0591327.1 NUDIX domain-containing protein [Halomonas sp. PAR8]
MINDSRLPAPHIARERIQLVDSRNRPCGSAWRAEMRRFRFWHRATYVVVCNTRGELCVQRRTLTKEVFPGGLDLAAGGVVGAGEAVHLAARRELEEELGIHGATLVPAGDFVHARDGNHIFGSLYLVEHDGPLALQAEEVAEAFWLPPAEALALEGITPDTRQAVEILRDAGLLEGTA